MATAIPDELVRLTGYWQMDRGNAPLIRDIEARILALKTWEDVLAATGRLNPDGRSVVEATLLEAQWLFQAGAPRDAATRTLAIARESGSAELYHLAYDLLHRAGEPAALVTAQEQDYYTLPGGGPGFAAYLAALHHQGRLADILHLAAQGAARGWHLGEVSGNIALAHLDLGQLLEAEQLLAHHPEGSHDLPGLCVKGYLALARRQLPEARAYLEAALGRNAQDGRCLLGLGLLTLVEGRMEDGEVLIEKAATAMPRHLGTLNALAWTRYFLGKPQEAIQTFESAIAIDRNFSENYGGLAYLLAATGQTQAARKACEICLRLNPGSPSGKVATLFMEDSRLVVDGRLREEALAAILAGLSPQLAWKETWFASTPSTPLPT